MTAPLWSSWPALQRRVAAADRLLVFLDYDGTLTPIADHPSRARLSASLRRLLERLARRADIHVALISGRRLSDLKRMTGVPGLCYIGNHGLELESPACRYVNPGAQAARPLLRQIARRLRAAVRPIPGAWVEDKGLTLSLHYRAVLPQKALLVRNGFYEVLEPYLVQRRVHVTTGKQVLEVRPPVRWTKGTIVEWLLARCLASAGEASVIPIYVGDDDTDEEAFAALQDDGITVAVGPSTPLTRARYTVNTPADVRRLLQQLLEARRRS
ncbi:MAG: trehalose-phosphatase [Candidatus Omnitrophica bacterium]|nr:trehalose-phosphatase [Candidatus Omnitrophota bacterium]